MARSRGTLRHAVYGAWMLVWTWAPAILAIAAFGYRPGPWTLVLALVVVTARQHAMFVVAHESWHKNLFPGARANRFFGAWLAAYPVVIPWVSTREGHLEHHRKVGRLDDPDRYAWFWRRHERGAFVRHLLATATGLPFMVRTIRIVLGVPVPPPRPGILRAPTFGGGRGDHVRIVVTHLILLGAFAGTIGWMWYFVLWLWPAVSIRIVLDETRQFLEHRGGLLHVYRAGPIERFVLGPFNFHLHAYHHAFASEPWFGLASVKDRARERETIHEQRSYLRELVLFFAGKSKIPDPTEELPEEPSLRPAVEAAPASARSDP